MDIQHVILFFTGMLLISIVVQPIVSKSGFPLAAGLILAGYLMSEVLVYYSIDTGIRWDNFRDLVFYVFFPILIYEAAFNMNARLLFKNLLPVLFLSVPMMLVSTLGIAVVLYYGIGHPEGFPWVAALLTGALLSATDPAAVLGIFRKMNISKRLSLLVEGESLFNDAAAIVLYSMLLGIALMSDADINMGDESLGFLKVFAGGLLVGLFVGGMGYLLIPVIRDVTSRGVLSLVSAYLSYFIAESGLHVSGVMAVLVAGLVLGQASRADANQDTHRFMASLWQYKSYIANSMVFLISGITIQLAMFTDQWYAILIGIAAATLARAAAIFGLFPLVNIIPGIESVGYKHQLLIYWGGVRGAVTLALALSLPTDLPYWWTIQSVAYGFVIFTLIVQAPTMSILLKHAE